MKALKKLAVIAISCAVLLTSFAGCNQGKKGVENSQGNVNNQNAASAEVTNKLPLTDKKVTLKYWVPVNPTVSSAMSSLNDSLTYQELEKRTGVHIEFINPVQAQSKEQFNLMVASGDLPDIVQKANTYAGGGEQAVADGAYIKLNEMIDKYAPNYNKLKKSNPEIAKQISMDDGTIWAFWPILKQENPVWFAAMFKGQWLKDVNMTVPETVSDWYNVLRAFKEKKGATAPFILSAGGVPDYGILLNAYDVELGFYKVNDKIKYGRIEPAFRDYLAEMRKWYQEGLIDKDFPTRNVQAVQSMFASEKTGAVIENIDGIFNIGESMNIEVVAAPYPVLKKGDVLHSRPKDFYTSPDETAITSACKDPVLATKWLDYAYGEEGHMLFNFGVEGQTYVMENGKPKFTELVTNNKDVPMNLGVWKFKMHASPQLRWGAYSNPTTLSNPKVLTVKEQLTKTGFDHMIPPTTKTKDESQKYTNVMNSVTPYVNQMTVKFIIGAEPLEKFDSFVAQIKTMGIDEAIKIEQAAYDRYLKR